MRQPVRLETSLAVSTHVLGKLLAENQIDDPAASDMGAGLAAMIQNVSVVAAGIFKGVAKDGQAVESTVTVDSLGKADDICCLPVGIGDHRPKGVANNIPQK
jgi:hypothetical protein